MFPSKAMYRLYRSLDCCPKERRERTGGTAKQRQETHLCSIFFSCKIKTAETGKERQESVERVTETQSKEGGNKQTQTQNRRRRTDTDRATITLSTPLQFLPLQVCFLFTCCMLSFYLCLHYLRGLFLFG